MSPGKLSSAFLIEKAKELGMITFLLLMLAELSPRKELWRPMILVLSLLIYQNTSYRFDEYNRTIVLDGDRGWLWINAVAI